eukprot:TRINITY_DN66943_c6_g1_i1.p1 TRINITY_DN66943_c6_g1~~TRINITY_DN66943_c6_g1_i1.p1  ORF type:complete len:309 (-),score=17.06 TRINITY_DN66943_c6_g1_i1:194-1120(-)
MSQNDQPPTPAPPPPLPFKWKLFVGSVAGIVGVSMTFTLDYCKTMLQRQSPSNPGFGYKSFLDCYRGELKRVGFIGMHDGYKANIVGILPEKGLKLACFDQFCDLLKGNNREATLLQQLCAGAGAGFCQDIATTPMEMVKLNMQGEVAEAARAGREPMSTSQLVNKLGFRGCYSGYVATVARDIPYSAMFFSGQAQLKKVFTGGRRPPTFAESLSAGIISGVISGILATPMDVIKTRMQNQHKLLLDKADVPWGKPYASLPSAYVRLPTEEGVKALFKGSSPRAIATAPLMGISVALYDIVGRYVHKQ